MRSDAGDFSLGTGTMVPFRSLGAWKVVVGAAVVAMAWGVGGREVTAVIPRAVVASSGHTATEGATVDGRATVFGVAESACGEALAPAAGGVATFSGSSLAVSCWEENGVP